jgi:surface antigen
MPSFDDSPPGKSFSQGTGRPARRLGLLSAENQSTLPLPVSASQAVPDPETDKTAILPVQFSPSPSVSASGFSWQPGSATRVLSRTTSELGDPAEHPTKRVPVRIKAEKKQAQPPKPNLLTRTPQHKRRKYASLTALGSLVLITILTFLTATPLGHDLSQNIGSAVSNISMISQSNSNLNVQAPATATAVSQQESDGYDPYATGGQTITNGSSSLSWPLGQCTYWANYRYHQLTGYWVSWTGNADQWVAGAKAAGWDVSTQPPPGVPSIIVLMPYVQGAYGYGHVAVVESIVGASSTATPTSGTPAAVTPTPKPAVTTVYTSNMNWWTGGGGWDIVSYVDFTVGSSVYFVWHPEA